MCSTADLNRGLHLQILDVVLLLRTFGRPGPADTRSLSYVLPCVCVVRRARGYSGNAEVGRQSDLKVKRPSSVAGHSSRDPREREWMVASCWGLQLSRA